jgi:hypothetical protein
MTTRFVVLVLSTTVLLLAKSKAPYRVTHTYTLGGDGSWDYVVPDPPNHRLFIARQTRVMVVDEDKGTLLGEVSGINGAHGTALASSSGHGFATSGEDKAVIMFDAKTFKSLKRIPAAEDADAIIYDPASDRVFSLNGDAHSSTVIDSSGNLVTNIPLGGKPEYGASAGDGKVYANLTDTSEVVEIDSKAAKVVRRLAHRCMQAAGFHGDRHGTSSLVQWMPERRDGRLRLSGGTSYDNNSHWHGRGWRGLRSGLRECLRFKRRWNPDRDSPGFAGSIPRSANDRDTAGIAQHGPRSDQPSAVCGFGEVGPRSLRRQTRTCDYRFLRVAGNRTVAP